MATKPKWTTLRVRVMIHRKIKKIAEHEGTRVETIVERLLLEALPKEPAK